MPESSRRVYATHVVRISKVIAAPLGYVYDWCTDYRADDGQYTRSKPRFRVFRLSPDRIVRVRYLRRKAAPPAVAAEVIRLRPPDRWHLDQIDESDLNTIDYKLTRLGPRKTRLTLSFVERWMVPDFPPKAQWSRRSSGYWDGLVSAIEQDYRTGRPAKR